MHFFTVETQLLMKKDEAKTEPQYQNTAKEFFAYKFRCWRKTKRKKAENVTLDREKKINVLFICNRPGKPSFVRWLSRKAQVPVLVFHRLFSATKCNYNHICQVCNSNISVSKVYRLCIGFFGPNRSLPFTSLVTVSSHRAHCSLLSL